VFEIVVGVDVVILWLVLEIIEMVVFLDFEWVILMFV